MASSVRVYTLVQKMLGTNVHTQDTQDAGHLWHHSPHFEIVFAVVALDGVAHDALNAVRRHSSFCEADSASNGIASVVCSLQWTTAASAATVRTSAGL
jgi:hypothetical protein